jgi:predicted nuclease of restriction endonuclease-like (RecB) superfamily
MMLINESILSEIKSIITESRQAAIRAVDHQRVLMYWKIGKRIFEEEQEGKDRAGYGKYLIKFLSKQLQPQFGTGFSSRNLNLFRQFYRDFPIVQTLSAQLGWSQYVLLLRIDNQDKRDFYISETIKNHWTVRQLERQINSHLYERLLLSNDKDSVMAIARGDRQPSDAKEIIKDPMVLEFLGLKQNPSFYEKDLESALITHLQEFLLELGNGFAFIARQKRIHLEGDDFFADLVLYNRILQCFVILEIKTHKLTHQDIGQLQMYVNYFDRKEKLKHENPTIGILLCTEKNNTVVKYSLPEVNKTIIASKYELYLPSEQQLIEEIQKGRESS